MRPIRIRLRTIRRALQEQSGEGEGGEIPADGTVRITDGQDPSKWVVVKLVEEEFRGQRYAVIEVVEMGEGTRIAFVTQDIKV